jgi:hypothetical protein
MAGDRKGGGRTEEMGRDLSHGRMLFMCSGAPGVCWVKELLEPWV